MKRVTVILFAILFIFTICGCTPKEPKNAETGKRCVECGDDATHLAGTGWIESKNENGVLYLCDDCYDSKMQWYEDNNRIVNDKWWE